MEKIFRHLTVVLLLISLFPVVCFGQQEISGPQSGTLGPGIYLVVGDIQVEAGETLTIEPGTTFKHASGNYIWEIHGAFNAIGTISDSIYFVSDDGVSQLNRWSGLRFQPDASAAMMNYCVVDNAFVDVDLNAFNYFAALNYWKGEGITIKHCRVSNNYSTYYGGGICISDGYAHIDSCLVVNNYQSNHGDGVGIYILHTDDSYISNSIIAFNETSLNGS